MIGITEKEISPDLIRLRNKYPALVGNKTLWSEIKRLVNAGDIASADDMAANRILNSPRFDLRNRIAVRGRIYRNEFVRYELEIEKQVKDLFVKFYDRVERLILSSAGDDGKIPRWKMKPLIDRIAPHNTQVYADLRTLLAGAIRKSVRFGIVVNMKSARAGLDSFQKMMNESDLKEAPEIGLGTDIFQTIFNRVQKSRIKKGLFVGGGNQPYTSGASLSQQIWNQKTLNMIKLRNIVSSGIAQGTSARKIATDTKRYTYSTGEPDYKMTTSGPGVYRTAFNNALRVARTETNSAYVAAGNEYAAQKGYQQMWNVSVGKRTEDECCIEGTMIKTFNGDKKIEDIKIGDSVLTHKGRFRIVKRIFKNSFDGLLLRLCFQEENNCIHELVCTPNHPFLIGRKWVKAHDLKMGCSGIAFSSKQFLFHVQSFHGENHTIEQDSEKNGKVLLLKKGVSESHDGYLFFYNYIDGIYRIFFSTILKLLFENNIFHQIFRFYNLGYFSPFYSKIIAISNVSAFPKFPDNVSRNYNYENLSVEHISLSRTFFSYLKDQILNRKFDKLRVSSCDKQVYMPESNIFYPVHNPFFGNSFYKPDIQSNDAYTSKPLNICGSKKSKIVELIHAPLEFLMVSVKVLFCKLNSIFSLLRHCIYSYNHIPVKLIDKSFVDLGVEFVYNLYVDEDNSYFANGIAVHNCDDYNGQTFDPEELASIYPPHPFCSCYFTMVVPEEMP